MVYKQISLNTAKTAVNSASHFTWLSVKYKHKLLVTTKHVMWNSSIGLSFEWLVLACTKLKNSLGKHCFRYLHYTKDWLWNALTGHWIDLLVKCDPSFCREFLFKLPFASYLVIGTRRVSLKKYIKFATDLLVNILTTSLFEIHGCSVKQLCFIGMRNTFTSTFIWRT